MQNYHPHPPPYAPGTQWWAPAYWRLPPAVEAQRVASILLVGLPCLVRIAMWPEGWSARVILEPLPGWQHLSTDAAVAAARNHLFDYHITLAPWDTVLPSQALRAAYHRLFQRWSENGKPLPPPRSSFWQFLKLFGCFGKTSP